MISVVMPQANENMTEATLQEWLVQEGQRVEKDAPLCVIITDKATFELPSPEAGILRKCFGTERSVLPTGYILCALGGENEPVPESYDEKNRALLEAHRGTVAQARAESEHAPTPSAPPLGLKKIRATPAARRKAKAAKVSLDEIAKALQIKGAINEKDVDRYMEGK